MTLNFYSVCPEFISKKKKLDDKKNVENGNFQVFFFFRAKIGCVQYCVWYRKDWRKKEKRIAQL